MKAHGNMGVGSLRMMAMVVGNSIFGNVIVVGLMEKEFVCL